MAAKQFIQFQSSSDELTVLLPDPAGTGERLQRVEGWSINVTLVSFTV